MYQIAIDGPVGSGKSTVARLCAEMLDFKYIDTGAMYRGFALYCTEKGVDIYDETALADAAKEADISVGFIDGTQHTYVNGEDVSARIRSQAVAEATSIVSESGAVRAKLSSWQREFGKKENIVMDGRDIGTVVLPEATLKVYLTASENVRAERRFKELRVKEAGVSLDCVLAQNRIRDERDINRKLSPLKAAPDALVINTDEMDIKTVSDIITRLAKQRIAQGV